MQLKEEIRMLWGKVSGAFDRFLDVLSVLVMVIMVVQMLGIVVHVILRYVFVSPWQGTMAWAQISLVWILFLGTLVISLIAAARVKSRWSSLRFRALRYMARDGAIMMPTMAIAIISSIRV